MRNTHMHSYFPSMIRQLPLTDGFCIRCPNWMPSIIGSITFLCNTSLKNQVHLCECGLISYPGKCSFWFSSNKTTVYYWQYVFLCNSSLTYKFFMKTVQSYRWKCSFWFSSHRTIVDIALSNAMGVLGPNITQFHHPNSYCWGYCLID